MVIWLGKRFSASSDTITASNHGSEQELIEKEVIGGDRIDDEILAEDQF